MNALEIAKARLAQVRADRAGRGDRYRIDSRAGQGNRTCGECAHGIWRKLKVGDTTITIGKPEFKCGLDGSFRSPLVKNDCPEHVTPYERGAAEPGA